MRYRLEGSTCSPTGPAHCLATTSVDSYAPRPNYPILKWRYPHIHGVDLPELNSYDIGGLSLAIFRCVPSDCIRNIFGATGEGQCELREDPTHALHYSNYIFIQSDEEDVRNWLLSNQPNEDPLDVLVYCHRPSTPARPAIPPEPRHRYLAPNGFSNGANALAGGNVNPAAQPKAKAIPMNSTKASESQNPQDSHDFLLGCSSSSSDVSDNFYSHRSRVVSMRSPDDQGSDSKGRRIPLSIKPQVMLNTHRIMKQLSIPTHDHKARKRRAQFDIDNWDERRSKMQCLVASAINFLKDDQLHNHRMVFADDSKDELQVKRQCLPPRE